MDISSELYSINAYAFIHNAGVHITWHVYCTCEKINRSDTTKHCCWRLLEFISRIFSHSNVYRNVLCLNHGCAGHRNRCERRSNRNDRRTPGEFWRKSRCQLGEVLSVSTAADRSRLLAAATADNGSGDWRSGAIANGVSPSSTAYQPPKKRGVSLPISQIYGRTKNIEH